MRLQPKRIGPKVLAEHNRNTVAANSFRVGRSFMLNYLSEVPDRLIEPRASEQQHSSGRSTATEIAILRFTYWLSEAVRALVLSVKQPAKLSRAENLINALKLSGVIPQTFAASTSTACSIRRISPISPWETTSCALLES